MLVLSRHKSQLVNIVVPKGYKGLTEEVKIDVIVVQIDNDKTRLGFNADKKIEIDRSEVRKSKKHNKLEKPTTNSLTHIPLKEKYFGSKTKST